MIKLIDIDNINIVTSNKRLIKARGRFISNPKYAAFKKHIWAMTLKRKLEPHYYIKIYAECSCDIDNVIKPILDALQLRGVIDDDKNISRMDILKNNIPSKTPGRIIVWGEGGYSDRIIPMF